MSRPSISEVRSVSLVKSSAGKLARQRRLRAESCQHRLDQLPSHSFQARRRSSVRAPRAWSGEVAEERLRSFVTALVHRLDRQRPPLGAWVRSERVVRGTANRARIRAATSDEVEAIAAARRGGEVVFSPSRSHSIELDKPVPEGDIRVVGQAFAEFSDGGPPERWVGREHHGGSVPTDRDATLELLELARESLEDRIDLLSDLRIAELRVTRWQIFSAPCVIELDPGLESQLAPLQRG